MKKNLMFGETWVVGHRTLILRALVLTLRTTKLYNNCFRVCTYDADLVQTNMRTHPIQTYVEVSTIAEQFQIEQPQVHAVAQLIAEQRDSVRIAYCRALLCNLCPTEHCTKAQLRVHRLWLTQSIMKILLIG